MEEPGSINLMQGHGAPPRTGGPPLTERVFSYDLELLADGTLHFVRVDDELLRIWGYTLAELHEGGWNRLILPRDRKRMAGIIRITQGGGTWTGQIRTVSRDGGVRVLALHLEPEVLVDRTLVRALARDVTDAALANLSLQGGERVGNGIVIGELEVDPDGYIVKKRGEEIPLTITEFKLLMEFVREPGRVLTQQKLAEHVWGHDFISTSNVPMAVKRLRDKIEDDPREPTIVETVRGIGYRMRLPEA